jgi:hypothetical protein
VWPLPFDNLVSISASTANCSLHTGVDALHSGVNAGMQPAY